MQIIQVLPVDQQVQHVVALAADLRRSRVAKPHTRSDGRVDGVAAPSEDLSRRQPSRPDRGPNALDIGNKTTHFHHSWRRVIETQKGRRRELANQLRPNLTQ